MMLRGNTKLTVLGAAVIAAAAGLANAAAFTAGDLAVYRVGTGSGSLANTGNAVFIDEYTPAGVLVQSIAMPTAASGANNPLFASGTATSEGFLSRSSDGQYLVLTGYGATSASGSVANTTSASVARVVGLVNSLGTVDTSTALTDFSSGNNIRTATSTNGTDLWVGGATGIAYTTRGSTTSTALASTNTRQLNVVGGQLYASSGSGTNTTRGVNAVGTNTPVSGPATVARIPGLTDATNPSTYGFAYADLSPDVDGIDTLYVADDAAGALTKFSLVGGSWVSNGTVGTGSDAYRGLTLTSDGNTVTLYATRKGGSGATGGGELVSLVDTSGYDGAFSGTPTVLVTASANTAFRGVVFTPVAIPEPSTVGLVAGAAVALAGRRRRK